VVAQTAALIVILLAIGILDLAATWKVFVAAGKPGWACIVPFYQGWTLAKIGGKPAWWGLFIIFNFSLQNSDKHVIPRGLFTFLSVVSLGSLILNIIISIGVAKNFGRSALFGVLLALFPFIGYPIMAYGKKPLEYKPIHTS
jgi:hypothetical protein